MSVEAYDIAVKISLINSVSAGLLQMSQHFAKTGKDADELSAKLRNIKLLLGAGAASTGVGIMGLGLIEKTIKPASEYVHQLEQMNVAGMKHVEIINATKAAWDAGKTVPTSSVSENLAAVRELRMVFGNTEDATKFMPVVQKVGAILENVKGTQGHGMESAYEVAKAIELKGGTRSVEEFVKQADMMVRAIITGGGKVLPSDFTSAFKYGRSATIGWSDDFAYTILPTLIQEMKSGGGSGGAGGPGNALMSLYAAVNNGTISQKALGEWTKLHLLDASKVVYDKVGAAKGVQPGGIKGSEIFDSSPYVWMQQILMPALEKAGFKTDQQKRNEIAYLFQNRTAGAIGQQMGTQGWKFDRDQALIRSAQGLAAYDELLKNDPMMARVALEKQWESLMAILGYEIMPVVVKGTLWLIDTLRELGRYFHEHPLRAQAFMYGIAGLSALFVVGGVAMMATAGISALTTVLSFSAIGGAAGIAGVGTALATVATGLGALLAAYAVYEVAKRTITPLIDEEVNRDSGGRFLSPGDLLYQLRHPNEHFDSATPAKSKQPIVVHSTLKIDGKVAAQSIDDVFGSLYNGGAGRGSTQLDYSHTVPPIAAVSGAK